MSEKRTGVLIQRDSLPGKTIVDGEHYYHIDSVHIHEDQRDGKVKEVTLLVVEMVKKLGHYELQDGEGL